MQRFVPPPNWPRPPEGWVPPAGWNPDPAWGPAPDGWQFWVDDAPLATAPPWALPTSQIPVPSVTKTVVITVLFGLFGLIPAYLDAEKAKRAVQPTGKYWVAFGASMAGSIALWVVTSLALVATLVHGANTAITTAGRPPAAAGSPNNGTAATSSPAIDGSDGTCTWSRDSSGNSARPDVGMPPQSVPTSGTAELSMDTNFGVLHLALDQAQAPCASASFAYLAGKHFFDNTPCHRETSYAELKVLQCGDPSGTGSGGPGYQFPTHVTGKEAYPRGTLAMANSGQGFDGSQFFLVYGDSQLPPEYTVVGTVDEAGLAVLDAIAANGNNGANGPDDGAPTKPVTITSMTVAR